MTIHKVTRWSVEAVMASVFRAGRVFLVGGCGAPPPADRQSGIDQRDPRRAEPVLEAGAGAGRSGVTGAADTYEAGRRPVDQRNAQHSLENAVNHFGIGAALGVSHENTPEQNMEQLRRMWGGRPEDAGHRSGVLRAMRAQSMEFSELNVEFGYRYESAAVVPDGSAAPAPADEIRVYQPFTRPGAPLPHAWIDDEDGHRRPVKDLLAPGRFLLLAGEDGQAWCRAARRLAAEAGVPLDAVRIGHLDGDYHDPRCAWQRRQIASDGATLVRPDRFIAWRSSRRQRPRAVLAAALNQILARPVGRVARPARPRPLSQQPPSGPLAGVPHRPPARP